MFMLASMQEATESVANVFSRFDALAYPEQLVPHLQQLPTVLAAIFVAAGLVCLLQGFKLYKAVVVAIALITGIVTGYRLGQMVQAEVIVAGCLGVLLAVVAWPLMKYAVAIAGGIAGAFLGANTYAALAIETSRHGSTLDPNNAWIAALVGLMMLGLLSFILFDLSVVLFTTVSGSILAVMGIFALLLQIPGWQDAIARGLVDKPIVLPMLVIVPAVIGLVLQQQRGAFKNSGNATPAPAGAKK